MSNKSSPVPFLTSDEDQNLHVKMVKNSGKPGLNCTESPVSIVVNNSVNCRRTLISKNLDTGMVIRNKFVVCMCVCVQDRGGD